jgi:glyoxylase-like metal-dependent hydrolase (beta-lactamase superfamily II)
MDAATNAPREVAPGVYLLERAHVNCYLIALEGSLVLVDAGLPRTWPLLHAALRMIGARPADIDAVVLTHGHFDHVGMCERLVTEYHRPVRVHEADRALVRHPYRYAHENIRWGYPFRYPRSIPVLAGMVGAGAIGIKGVEARGDVMPGREIVPGLLAVASPGHTAGHCGFLLEKEGVLFSGDALVTLDPYTGATGPQIVAGAATADSAQALAGLDAFAATGARRLLPGHGAPLDGDVGVAVRAARGRGSH